MYGAFCVLLMTGLILLTVSRLRLLRQNEAVRPRWLLMAEGILCGGGILLHPVLLLLLRLRLDRGEWEADFADWAWDAVLVYLRYALPALGIFFGITVLCALSARWDKKYRTPMWTVMRSVCSLAASAVLLALAAFFGAMTRTEEMALDIYVYLLGAAGALTLRGMYLAEPFGR